jgi:serine/threonine-protein kinase RsbW
MSGISLDQKGFGPFGQERRPARQPRGGRTAHGEHPVRTEHTGLAGQPAEVQRLAVVSFAADKDFLALARMTAMHVAGLAGLPIGRVTDLRLAVDEACALFLAPPAGPHAPLLRGPHGSAKLTLRFDRLPGHLRISVTGPLPPRPPDENDLGWTMLCALVGSPRWEVRDGLGTLTLTEPLPASRA